MVVILRCYRMRKFRFFLFRFLGLKRKLLQQLNQRFEEMLRDEHFIAASVLNPRVKLRVFQSAVAPGLQKPSTDEAIQALKQLLKNEEVMCCTMCSRSEF